MFPTIQAFALSSTVSTNSKSPKIIISNTLWCLKLVFQNYRVLYLSIVTIGFLTSTLPFVRNRIFSDLIDNLVGKNLYWFQSFLIFIILLVITSIFFYLQSLLNRVLDINLQAFLRKLFIGKVSSLDYQHLEGKETANLISKVDEEFGWRSRQTITDINGIFTNLISLVAITIILLPKFPFLWLLIILGQIPQYFYEKHWIQKDWRLYETHSDKNKQMWDLNYQLRQKNYLSELRVNNAVSYLYQKFASIFDFFSNTRTQLRVNQSPGEFILIIFSTSINAFCLLTLIQQTILGHISIGLFTFYFQSISQTSDFFRSLVFSSVSITENSYHIGNFRSVMELKNNILGGSITLPKPHPPVIEFENVSFKYPGSQRYIFKNLNLKINSGEEIAIVGQNGAGKSTLIKLLCHFYQPNTGRILINGIDLRQLSLESWFAQLSYLAQEFVRYHSLSLKENVLLGNPTSTINDQKVINALNLADAGFIKKYSQGLDTPLSQRYGGEEPSWGQSQKIAIARIFYRNSPVIILDEPTASIDAVSESKIFSRLFQNLKNKTLIIVSHRFSTVRNAQRIIVIDKGKIIEQGSHQELLSLNGSYAKSFKLQARGYTD